MGSSFGCCSLETVTYLFRTSSSKAAIGHDCQSHPASTLSTLPGEVFPDQ